MSAHKFSPLCATAIAAIVQAIALNHKPSIDVTEVQPQSYVCVVGDMSVDFAVRDVV